MRVRFCNTAPVFHPFLHDLTPTLDTSRPKSDVLSEIGAPFKYVAGSGKRRRRKKESSKRIAGGEKKWAGRLCSCPRSFKRPSLGPAASLFPVRCSCLPFRSVRVPSGRQLLCGAPWSDVVPLVRSLRFQVRHPRVSPVSTLPFV